MGSGTYTATTPVQNAGGQPNLDTFVVIACPSVPAGNSGTTQFGPEVNSSVSGSAGNTGVN